MPFVYILLCADSSLYIGVTANLEARVARHNNGEGSAFTAARRPVHLVFSETFETMADTLARERQLKRWTRRKKEALIAGR
jgi:putative endonuclease